MNKEELKNFHYTHKNEIQFEYGGQVHHYNIDNLKEVIITAWELQERINKAIDYMENNPLYEEEYDYDYEENSYLSGIDDEIAKKDLLEILKGGD